MRSLLLLGFVLVLFAVLSAPSLARAQASFQVLADRTSHAADVSADGESVLYSRFEWAEPCIDGWTPLMCEVLYGESCPYCYWTRRAYRLRDALTTSMGTLPCEYVTAEPWCGSPDYDVFQGVYPAGISDDGEVIVGGARLGVIDNVGGGSPSTYNRAFRWQSGSMQDLGEPGDYDSELYQSRMNDASADGSMDVGSTSFIGDRARIRIDGVDVSSPPALPAHFGCNADPNDLVCNSLDLNAVSGAGGVAVGHLGDFFVTEAFYWVDGLTVPLGDLPGGDLDSTATAVSQRGGVIVGIGTGAAGSEAFRWQHGVITGLGTLPGASSSSAYAVRRDGDVIGGESEDEAFVWDSENGMRRLQDILETDLGLDLQGLTLTRVVAMSADGLHMVGDAETAGGSERAWLAELPASAFPALGPAAELSMDSVPGISLPVAALVALGMIGMGRKLSRGNLGG